MCTKECKIKMERELREEILGEALDNFGGKISLHRYAIIQSAPNSTFRSYDFIFNNIGPFTFKVEISIIEK